VLLKSQRVCPASLRRSSIPNTKKGRKEERDGEREEEKQRERKKIYNNSRKEL
jgi:hypothetical protein